MYLAGTQLQCCDILIVLRHSFSNWHEVATLMADYSFDSNKSGACSIERLTRSIAGTIWSTRMNIQLARRPMLLILALFSSLMLVSPQAATAQPDPELFSSVDSYVEEQMERSRIPGVALSITRGSEISYMQGYGETANTDEAVTSETLFGIGSTGKSITALAVMQLAEAGQIDPDKPVQNYIPWFSLADPQMSEQLTVRHLLNMTSGIPVTAGGEAFRSTESLTPEAAIQTLQSASFAYEPGTRFEYVNANYVILGHLVEVVSGQSYGDYVQQHIFDPLDMRNTYTDLDQAQQAGFTGGHRYWFGQPVAHQMDPLPALVPAGYIVSTADDLSNYLMMYLNDGVFAGQRILSSTGIEEMHRGVADATLGPWAGGATAKYAMGWYVGGPWGDGSMIFHPGSEPTFTAMLTIDQENNLGTVTLVNAATEMPLPGAAGALRTIPSGVASILNGEEPGTASLNRFYLVFNLATAVVIGLQIFTLVRLVRQPIVVHRGWVRRALPLVWEFGAVGGILLAPAVLGMSWRSILLWTPDLAIAAIVIAGLSLTIGLVRLERLIRYRPAQPRSVEILSTSEPDNVIRQPVT
jgi:CubicO group peptidase (beta-lactamase class C family)